MHRTGIQDGLTVTSAKILHGRASPQEGYPPERRQTAGDATQTRPPHCPVSTPFQSSGEARAEIMGAQLRPRQAKRD